MTQKTLEQEIDDLREEVSERDATIDELKDEIKEHEETIENLEKEIEIKRGEISDLETTIDAMEYDRQLAGISTIYYKRPENILDEELMDVLADALDKLTPQQVIEKLQA